MNLATPKRHATAIQGKATWYSYYAGFSPAFVVDALKAMALPPKSRIIDPWNGSGTTTQVADESGFIGVGYDINPVMVMVAKARLLPSAVRPSHDSICQAILDLTRADLDYVDDKEPLCLWLQPSAAQFVRKIEVAIQKLTVSSEHYTPIRTLTTFSGISSLAAFFYVALFRVVREIVSRFGTSNPTWLKIPSKRERLRPDKVSIEKLFRAHVAAMATAQWGASEERQPSAPPPSTDSIIDLANSTSLPEADDSVSAVVCSPPYCTRIDYAVATRIELAVLGFWDLRSLREKMIGTAVIAKSTPERSAEWGPTCNSFLDQMTAHSSKASKSYYLKNHLQYFDSLHRSVVELDRVLRSSGQAIMVVQDSFYKDIRNDLPQIAVEMGKSVGWSLVARADFSSIRNMGQVNPSAKSYRQKTPAVESALRFQK